MILPPMPEDVLILWTIVSLHGGGVIGYVLALIREADRSIE